MNAPMVPAPPRVLPVIQAGFCLLAVALLYAPFVVLGEGAALSLMSLAGAWATTTFGLLAFVAIAALMTLLADRVTWERLLVVDMLIVVALLPAVIGAVVRWETPADGVAFAWGFWAAVALLVARFPLSIRIRRHAARAQLQAQAADGEGADASDRSGSSDPDR